MNKTLSIATLFAVFTLGAPAWATSANGHASGTSFGGGTPQSAVGGGISANGGASGNSFGSETVGTDRVNSDDDNDGVADTSDTAPKDNTVGGLNDVDTDHDGVVDSRDPTPTINDGTAETRANALPADPVTTPSTADQNVDGTTDTDGDVGTTGSAEGTSQPNIGEPDFSLHTSTSLPNPNNPDPRLNNGTTADDGSARINSATQAQ